ncbi:hypothetical protein [Streptomyces sp. NPDC002520]
MTSCELCGEETGGRYLCERDTTLLAARLDRMPKWYAALEGFLVPAVHGGGERVAGGRAEPGLPVNEMVLDLRYGGIALVLEGWRADAQRFRGWGEPVFAGTVERRVLAAARWLGMNLDWIAVEYPAAGDLAREVRGMEGAALSIVGDPKPKAQRLGTCVKVTADGSACGAVISRLPGETRLTCPWCSYTYATAMDWFALTESDTKETA